MAATRLLKVSKLPTGFGFSTETVSSSSFSLMGSRHRTQMCLRDIGLSSDTRTPTIGGVRKPVTVQATGSPSACILISEPKANKTMDLPLFANIAEVMSQLLEFITRPRPWRFHIQMFVEKVIIDCRFFALLAVAGSLIGSVLCFVQGCYLVLLSYLQYFHAMSKMSEQGHVVLLLIEAIDMFLVGIAMLIFGMAMHIMFVGTSNRERLEYYSASTSSNNFSLEKLSSWIKMRSVMQAKSKIGHAVILILQVEVLEKFKYMTTTSPLDLACYAGVVLMSSASIFILSRIALPRAEE